MRSKINTLKFYSSSVLPRLLLYIFLGLGIQTPLHSAQRINLCLAKLRTAIGEAQMPAKERGRILNRNVKEQNLLSAEMQIAWSKVSIRIKDEGGLREGENFFWLREDGLRVVNSATKGIAFTEKYLLLKDRHLSDILRETGWGEIVHRNFKDRVIVTKLDPKELYRKLSEEITRRIISDFEGWEDLNIKYLMEHTSLGAAKTFEGAHLQAAGFDITKWHKQCSDIRHALEKTITELKLRPADLLVKIFQVKKKGEAFGQKEVVDILRAEGISKTAATEMSHDVLDYLELLQGADMLPPPDALTPQQVITLEKWIRSGRNTNKEIIDIINRRPWTQRHAVFLRDAFVGKAKHIFALDIKGFSEVSFRIRDTWIMGDNSRKDLRKIYIDSTHYLDEYFDNLQKQIQEMFHIKTLSSYRSGDDALFAFGPEVTEAQFNQIQDFLRRQTILYSFGVSKKYPQESLGMLIELGRAGIGHEKDKLKEQNPDH